MSCWRSPPGLKRDPRAVSPLQAPFGRESSGVLIQQLFGINAIAGKGPAAEMVNEEIMRDRELESRPPRPLGEVVVIKESQSKPFIEPTDRLVNGPLHEQAKSRQLGHSEPLPAMVFAPVRANRCISPMSR